MKTCRLMAILSFSILIIMPCLASNKAEINWRDVTARLRLVFIYTFLVTRFDPYAFNLT
jgi:hypothetical protein